MNQPVFDQMAGKPGLIAALDQSGGSTPHALADYGIPEGSYAGEDEMFALMHAMRVRIMSAPAFTGEKVIAAILFERTMDGEAHGQPVPAYLWESRGVVPFLKVDKGLEEERDGVEPMKPIPGLDALLDRARGLGVFGTKMRSLINDASPDGIAAIVDQQFAIGRQIIDRGLLPILEPEVSIKSPRKAEAETLLRDALARGLDTLGHGGRVMLKLSIPSVPDLYAPLAADERVVRVVALSGGYHRDEACERLSHDHGMIASFSRALVEGLSAQMSDADFDATLAASIDQIFRASTRKA